MAKTVKLYDLREKNYPNKRGDTFRSLQVFECPVCKALSNKVIIGGSHGYGVRVICPHSSKCWHHELQEKKEWLDKPHPRSYKDELRKEIAEMKTNVPDDIKNDVKGNPEIAPLKPMTNTFSRVFGGSCKHFLGL